MNRYQNLRRIQGLDPERDHHEIYRTMVLVEFRWDMLLGLQLAFYRTYGVPSISRLLDQAGELTERPRKRAIDTALLMLELVDNGFSHPRGREVVRRLNRIHQHYEITNADFLYVLGTLIFVPTRWLERYGWRSVCCHERTATYAFYRELGRRMGIRDIPSSYQAFEAFFDAFEHEHFRPTQASRRLMHASRELLVGRFPGPRTPLAEGLADALLDDRLREAAGVDPPPSPIRVSLHLAFKIRARVLRFMPPRREPAGSEGVRYGIRTASIYPRGYRVSDLGPTEPRR
jgi:hypothetical protein